MKRMVFALDLADDPAAIAEYEAWHRPGRIWAAIVASLRESGLTNLELFRTGNRLCLITSRTALARDRLATPGR
jgi:L-rhamnose mutarotase